MGVVIKELPRMIVASFEGFAPEPENKAKAKLLAWKEKHPSIGKMRRIFGHTIDAQGRLDDSPQYVGYKFMISLENEDEADKAGSRSSNRVSSQLRESKGASSQIPRGRRS